MNKRKNYTRLFVDYCKRYELWFSVCVDSSLDQITNTVTGTDYNPKHRKFGSKAAYEWVKGEVENEIRRLTESGE